MHQGKACCPKIKVSESFEKIPNPGRKRLWRVYDKQGFAVADLITLADEKPDFSRPYPFVDPQKPWETKSFDGHTIRELHEIVFKDGKKSKNKRSLEDIRAYVKKQLEQEIWPEEQRFENPHQHFLVMSPAYFQMKINLLRQTRN